MARNIPETKRERTATVSGPKGESKYPIFDERSARSALRLINHAKPALTAEQKAAVRRKAAKYGVKSEG